MIERFMTSAYDVNQSQKYQRMGVGRRICRCSDSRNLRYDALVWIRLYQLSSDSALFLNYRILTSDFILMVKRNLRPNFDIPEFFSGMIEPFVYLLIAEE